MSEALIFLGPALAMCIVIASIHVYLGMHVLAREVIFVDLSLAQLAALGATVGAVLASGHEHGSGGYAIHLLAFGFTVFGAAVFAFTRRARAYLSQEAVVGIVYAVASAAMILVLSRSPHGAEEIESVLVGSLLLTSWERVGQILAAYILLGGLQLLLARRFIEISWEPQRANDSVRYVEWWDFGFYLLFGIVITISVQVAGILLVFSFLIVPAVITRLFTTRIWPRLLAGWGVALAASMLGLWASWEWDLPTGAAVVVTFGALLMVAGAVRVVTGRVSAGAQ